MKKITAFILVLLSAALLLPVCALALEQKYELQYVEDSKITLDGVMSAGEWDGAVKISLTNDNTGTWANMTDESSHLPLDAYFLWGEKGIYVAADIYDNDVETVNQNDCFEVALNPGGLIPDGDELEGLFFTYWLDGDSVIIKRHNQLDEQSKYGQDVTEKGLAAYTLSDHGWYIETLIKWEWLTLSDRPVLDTASGEYKTGVLDKFGIKNGSSLDAIVCYLNGDSDKRYNCVYRTVTELDEAGNFSTATYDIVFTLTGQKTQETTVGLTDEQTEPQTAETDVDIVYQTETDGVTTAAAGNSSVKNYIIIGIIIVAIAVAVVLAVIKRKK